MIDFSTIENKGITKIVSAGNDSVAILVSYREHPLSPYKSIILKAEVEGQLVVIPILSVPYQVTDIAAVESLSELWLSDCYGNIITSAQTTPCESVLTFMPLVEDQPSGVQWRVCNVSDTEIALLDITVDGSVIIAGLFGDTVRISAKGISRDQSIKHPLYLSTTKDGNAFITDYEGRVHRVDGDHWTTLDLPPAPIEKPKYTQVLNGKQNTYLIASTNGWILATTSGGNWRSVNIAPHKFFSIAYFAGRYFFACERDGLLSIDESESLTDPEYAPKVVHHGDCGSPIGLTVSGNRLWITPSEKDDKLKVWCLEVSSISGEFESREFELEVADVF